SGIRRRALARVVRAGANAACDRRNAAGGIGRRDTGRGHAGTLPGARHGPGRGYTGGIRRDRAGPGAKRLRRGQGPRLEGAMRPQSRRRAELSLERGILEPEWERPAMFAESIKTNVPTDLLRTLVTVCEFRSFTKAAQLLQLTQPAVIQQIRKLEIIIGSEIIDRRLAGINLTESGLEILKSAQRLLSINDQIVFDSGNDLGLQIIRLGVPNLFARSVLPKIVAEIRSMAPHTQLQIC